jgi:Uncharacterized alpha/beta hydrolase domain (DUF2235)
MPESNETYSARCDRKDVVKVKGMIGLALIGSVLGSIVGWIAGNTLIGLGVGLGIAVLLSAVNLIDIWVGGFYAKRVSPIVSQSIARERNHIICIDGTWDTPEVPTNVARFFDALEVGSDRQIARYYQGVGTMENIGDVYEFRKKRFSKTGVGGAIGYGPYGAMPILWRSYFEFVENWRPGDRIFIFGFSRGAAIARVLANWICDTHGLPASAKIECLFMWTAKDVATGLTVEEPRKHGKPEVEFLGLWDTVAAFGIPWDKDEPFDLRLAPGVKKALHLVSIDEERKAFDVTLLDHDPQNEERVEEVWFAGAHKNVGGGLADKRLSDITLKFMLNRVQAKHGLYFKDGGCDINLSPITDSEGLEKAKWMPGKMWRFKIARAIRVQCEAEGKRPRIHRSVKDLMDAGIGYNPSNIPPSGAYEVVGDDYAEGRGN